MKRILSVIAVLLVCVSAFARNISKSEALKQASDFFGNASVDDLEVVWTGNSSDSPSFYAINNRKGGFVIISGSDNVNPVLGYAYDRQFISDNMPSHVAGWFGGLEKSIKEIEQKKIRLKDSERGLFNTTAPQTKGFNSARLIETAEWNQGDPYNAACNLGGGVLGVTGCVATAMAIILRHHQYPAKGTGTLESYTTGKYRISGYSLESHKYEWNKMPLRDSDVQRGTSEQKAQIAQLMHDCGVMVKMMYTPTSSGAYSEDILPALVEHMGYDPSTRFVHRDIYAASEWVNLLESSISDNCPVLYGSQSSSGGGGHQFVIDGFDGKGNFHVNWGWGGSDNGYFTLELAVDSYVFNASSDALLNLRPKNGDNTPSCELVLDNIEVKQGDICKDSDFTIRFRVGNFGLFDFSTTIKAAVVGKDGTIKEFIGNPIEDKILSYRIHQYDYDCHLSGTPDPNDRLVITFLDEKGETKILSYYHDGVSTGGLIFQPYTFLKTNPNGYKAGDYFDLDILSNKAMESCRWTFDGTSVDTNYVILTSGKHTVTVCLTDKEGNSETIVQEITVK